MQPKQKPVFSFPLESTFDSSIALFLDFLDALIALLLVSLFWLFWSCLVAVFDLGEIALLIPFIRLDILVLLWS